MKYFRRSIKLNSSKFSPYLYECLQNPIMILNEVKTLKKNSVAKVPSRQLNSLFKIHTHTKETSAMQ